MREEHVAEDRRGVARRAILLGVVGSTAVAAVSWLLAERVPGLLCYLVPVCPTQLPFGPEECAECPLSARVGAYVWLLVQSGLVTLVARRHATGKLPAADRPRFATTFGLTFWACSHLSYGVTFAIGEALMLLIAGPV